MRDQRVGCGKSGTTVRKACQRSGQAEAARGIAALAARIGTGAVVGECLAKHTTFGIGGPADLYAEAASRDELMDLLRLAHEVAVPCLVIGSGANLLVADKGVRGLVVRNVSQSIEFKTTGDEKEVLIEADSGCRLVEVAQIAVDRHLTGLEWAVDVPGTVGGAVVGNAGAFGGYISDVLTRALVFDLDSGARWWPKAELQMGYRTSCLKERYTRGVPSPIVLAGEFLVHSGEPAEISAAVDRNRQRRHETQPVGLSAGSVFKRTREHPAGYLIEQAGLKGTRVGDAVVCAQHANFILNLGGASAEDVRRLIELVRNTVHERFGVWLELEIQLVGEW